MTDIRTLLFVAAGVLAGGAAFAQTALLVPAERISDEEIDRDQRSYQRLQSRIRSLNERGRPVADYHLAKAQCWLEASWHEYSRNDRSAFPQAALDESEKLVAAMEVHAVPLPSETPLVAEATRLRPDLWQRVHELKQGPGFACAAPKAACAEVELVHAGHENAQQGWRHARPYLRIAEEQLAEASTLAERCAPQRRPR